MKDLSKTTKITLTAILAVGCSALAYYSFAPNNQPQLTEKEELVRAVRTAKIERKEAVQTRRFPAVLEPPQLVPLSFEVGGRVTEVNLKLGQQIKKGELLATIEPLDLDIRVAQAQAALNEAKVAAENAKKEAERQKNLFSKGITTAARKDQAVTQAEQAALRVEQAQSNVDLLLENRADTELRAPFDAVINDVKIQDYVSVSPGQPIMSIYQEGQLQASILVSFDVAKDLEVGREVNIVPADAGIAPLAATISEIGRRAPAVSSFPVIISIPNDKQTLLSGMAIDVQFETKSGLLDNLYAVPRTALNTNEVETLGAQAPFKAEIYVYAKEKDGKGMVEARDVIIAGATENSILIAGGINEGELVITAGIPFLRPGQIVTQYNPAKGN